MNPTSIEPPLPALQPPQPPQPNRLSTSCDLHPDEHFTGFCPACLCERLSSLHPNNNTTTTTTTTTTTSRFKPPTSSTAAAALKAIFKPSNNNNNKPSNSSSLLRRTQSFSASKNEGLSSCSVFEPQRKSCDVRVKNTLSCLFNQNNNIQEDPFAQKDSHVLENTNLASSSVQVPVVEGKSGQEEEYIEVSDDQLNVHVAGRASVSEDRVQEIVEEEEEEEEEEEGGIEQGQEELKPMKDYIDIDSQTKKSSGRPSIWSAASVFSKKLQKWRQKQKMKKQRNGGGSARLPVEKPIGRQLRDTQSEIADYGYGRRSCDTDPRFSLDIGRMSFDVPRMSFDAARMSLDDPRYSFDEPRASWDGYLIGRTMPLPPRMPTRLSVVEDAPPPPPPPPPHVHVLRSDMQIPVEEFPKGSSSDYEIVPGGTVQTRDYYLDSSTRRRKSLDRSSSIKNTAAAVVAEVEEMKGTSSANPKVSHNDHLAGSKFVVERDANSNYSSSLRDDGSERFDTGFRDNASVAGNCEGKGGKKSSRWSKAWSIWGLINKKGGTKDECEDDRFSRVNGVERSYSESWQGARGERNGEARGNFDPKMFRSNSSVAWRNSSNFGGSFSSVRNCGVEAQGQGRKKRDEFVLERNQSARYSTSSIDNGLLRFYLNPMSDSQRNGFGKSRSGHAQSIARRVLRLY